MMDPMQMGIPSPVPQFRPVGPVMPPAPPSMLRPPSGGPPQGGGGPMPFPTPPMPPGANSQFTQPGGPAGAMVRQGIIQNALFGNPYTSQGGAFSPMFNQIAQQMQPTSKAAPPTPPAPASTTGTTTTADSSSPSAFLKSMTPAALQASQETGLPADLLMAIAAHETGWGKSAPGNEFMGIKGTGPAGSVTTPAQEWTPSGYVNTDAAWKSYATPEQSLADFKNFLATNPRYGDALDYWNQTQDPAGLLRRINQAGYATNPNWWQEVLDVMNQLPDLGG